MDEAKPEVAIDIGGGKDEFFLRLAKENPEKTYIVLAPEAKKIEGTPPNLHFIRWRTDVDPDSMLPFSPGKIDEAYINFLFGEIGAKDDPYLEKAKNQPGYYRNLLQDLKRVLKPGSLLHITDVRGNIFNIQCLLEEEGYQVTQEPKRMVDEDKSWWSRTFAGPFKILREKEDSYILPMEIEARWTGFKEVEEIVSR